MVKLQQLTQFLINLDLVAVEQIDAWVENPRIIPAAKSNGRGILLYRQAYDAVISIERFPHKTHPAELLFAHVSAWLITNDSERDEIAQPRTEVDILDDDTADIEISIDFEEDIYITADPAGTIDLDGTLYRLADPQIDYAETGEVKT